MTMGRIKRRRRKALFSALVFMSSFLLAMHFGLGATPEARQEGLAAYAGAAADKPAGGPAAGGNGEDPGSDSGPAEGAEEAAEAGNTDPAREGSNYDFSAPVPEGPAVEDDYFDDAVFIGNSRTEGFMMYNGLKNARSLTHVGLMVDTAFTKEVIRSGDRKLTVMDALAEMKFNKVYIMLGMNELGWVYDSAFQNCYGRIIERIKEINPQARIFIQSILPVSQEKSGKDKIYNNKRIEEFNSLLRELAEKKQVYYVNVAEALTDDSGSLPADASFDGVHLKPDYCKTWLEYLKNHTIERG